MGAMRSPSCGQTKRGRWWASWRCHHGQSWALSWPHTSSSWRMPLRSQQLGERSGRRQRPGRRLLEGALPDDEQHRDPRAHPLEVVALHVRDVGRGVGEVGRVAELAPPVPRRRVVVAGQPDGQRGDVGALQGEVHRVVGAERDPDRDRPPGRRRPGRAPTAAPTRRARPCRSGARRARSSVGMSLSDHDHPSRESTQNRLTRPASTSGRTASSMPLCSASRAEPPSDGKSSTGRPHEPCRTTSRSAS